MEVRPELGRLYSQCMPLKCIAMIYSSQLVKDCIENVGPKEDKLIQTILSKWNKKQSKEISPDYARGLDR